MKTIYTMKQAEVCTVENEVSNAIHEVMMTLHTLQCDAVDRSTMTPAARVEIVLQLAKFGNACERAGYGQLNKYFKPSEPQ